jgi:hypothetical protein
LNWHNYFANSTDKLFFMDREEATREQAADKDKKELAGTSTNQQNNQEKEKLSYTGELDKTEGNLDHGEIGGGMKKESK